MSKRNRREHGRILSVETKNRGDSLADDFAAGVTSITVNDAGDFDEDGGWLYIGAQTVEYTECDDDTGVITLADPLAAAAEQGDPVSLWSDLYGEVVDYQLALVELDGEYDNPDPVAAEVAEGVGELPEGDRGKAGESCTLLLVSADEDGDEWEVVGVGGRPHQSQGTRWEQDDYYILTDDDITAGAITAPLSHRPNNEALTCVLAGVPQRPTNWAIDYNAPTLDMPLSGWEAVDDVLWVHYAYCQGITTTVIQPAEYVIPVPGAISVHSTSGGGIYRSPSIVIGGPPQWNDGSDATYAEIETFEHPDVSYADSAYGTLGQTAVPTSTAGLTVTCRVRYKSLAVDSKPPRPVVTRISNGKVLLSAPTPSQAASLTPEWLDIPLGGLDGDLAMFLAKINDGSEAIELRLYAPLLRTYSYRTPRMQIFEAYLVVSEGA